LRAVRAETELAGKFVLMLRMYWLNETNSSIIDS